jgi:hypothetical protein
MRNFVLMMILFVGMLAMSCTQEKQTTASPPLDVGYVLAVDQQLTAPVLNVQDEVAEVPAPVEKGNAWEYVTTNWGAIATILFLISELLAAIPWFKE